jgi:hypothetical protein
MKQSGKDKHSHQSSLRGGHQSKSSTMICFDVKAHAGIRGLHEYYFINIGYKGRQRFCFYSPSFSSLT